VTVDPDVRRAIATDRGLPATAVGLLTGETVHELEASADALVGLLAMHGREQPEPPDPVVAALQAGRAKQQAAVARLFRRHPQPRDEAGRFRPASSFDGGPRGPALPIRKPPEEEHGRLLSEIVAMRRIYGA
jgi:hypothetical protein